MNENNKEAGQKLRLLCRKYGFKKDIELARASGVPKDYLSKLFKGESIHKPGKEQAKKILEALGECKKVSMDIPWHEMLHIYQISNYPIPDEHISEIDDFIEITSNLSVKERDVKNNLTEDYRPKKVFGRKQEIDKLLNGYFLKSGRIIIISGIGGIGKTTLALEAAHLCLESSKTNNGLGFDAIIYTSAKSERFYYDSLQALPIVTKDTNLTDILNKISDVLNAQKIIREKDIKKQCQLAYQELNKYKTLLIIDNLETIDDQEDVLGFLKNVDMPDKVTTIVTTRQLPVIMADIPLHSLDEEDSLKLIQQTIQSFNSNANNKTITLSEDKQKELHNKSDGIPLVIEYSIGLLAADYQFKVVIDILEKSQNNLADFLFEKLVKQLNNTSFKLLLAMSTLSKPFRRDAIVAVAGLGGETDIEISDGFFQLTRLSLIRKSFYEEDAYSISSLTHNYASAQLRRNEQIESQLRKRWIKYYIKLAQDNGRKDLYDWERGNWAERFDVIEDQWENFEAVIKFCFKTRLYDECKSLWISLNNYTEIYGRWSSHFSWLEILTKQAQDILDRKTAIFTKSAIARVYIREGSSEHLDNAEKLLNEARNKDNDIEYPVKIELFENQIMLHIERKEYEQANDELQRLERFVQSLNLKGKDKIRYRLPYKYRKAQVLAATEKREDAKKIYREVIKDAINIRWILAVIGPQNRLADLLIEDSELDEAQNLLEDTLAATEKNKYHRRTAYCNFSLGRLYYKKGEISKVKRHYETAIDIFKRLGMIIQQQKVEELLFELSD